MHRNLFDSDILTTFIWVDIFRSFYRWEIRNTFTAWTQANTICFHWKWFDGKFISFHTSDDLIDRNILICGRFFFRSHRFDEGAIWSAKSRLPRLPLRVESSSSVGDKEKIASAHIKITRSRIEHFRFRILHDSFWLVKCYAAVFIRFDFFSFKGFLFVIRFTLCEMQSSWTISESRLFIVYFDSNARITICGYAISTENEMANDRFVSFFCKRRKRRFSFYSNDSCSLEVILCKNEI